MMTSDKGQPDDVECASCNEPIGRDAPIYCKPCFSGAQDDDDDEDGDDDLDTAPKNGRQCAECGKHAAAPFYCGVCMEQSSDTAAAVTAEFAKYSARRPQRSDAATNALETRIALRTIDAQKAAASKAFGPRQPTAKSLRAPANETELIIARAAAAMRGEQLEPVTLGITAPARSRSTGALDALNQWSRMTDAQQLAEARKTMKAMCRGIAGEDLEASARAFVASRNGARSSASTSLPVATLTQKQRTTLTELQRDAVAAGVDPERVLNAYVKANTPSHAPRRRFQSLTNTTPKARPAWRDQTIKAPSHSAIAGAHARLGLGPNDRYDIELDARGEVLSWRELDANGQFVRMRDPKTKRAVSAA